MRTTSPKEQTSAYFFLFFLYWSTNQSWLKPITTDEFFFCNIVCLFFGLLFFFYGCAQTINSPKLIKQESTLMKLPLFCLLSLQTEQRWQFHGGRRVSHNHMEGKHEYKRHIEMQEATQWKHDCNRSETRKRAVTYCHNTSFSFS